MRRALYLRVICNRPFLTRVFNPRGYIYIYVNLSDHKLTHPQRGILNLGSTCHLFKEFNQVQKQTEFEILYQIILKRPEESQIKTKTQLRDSLKAEATKNKKSKS